MTASWVWVAQAVVLAVHDEQIAEHGGAGGLCDLGPLGSALARPQHLAAYEPDADAPRLAATYAYGLARNHPFVDGNKRTALIVLELFSNLNGHRFDADDADCVATMLALAAGALSEEELAAWVAQHAHPASKDDAGAG